jgi:hypothetical protein
MANTRQTEQTQRWGVEDMVIHNHELVREHIDDLLREGALLRAERLESDYRASTAHAAAGHRTPGLAQAIRPARMRFGHWLVSIGWAVAGSPAESRGSTGQAGPVV